MLTAPAPGASAGTIGTAGAEPDPGLLPRLLALVLRGGSTTTTTLASPTTTVGATTTTTTAAARAATPPPPAAPALAPPTAEPAAAAANTQVGIASWYNDKAHACAHRTAPIGTTVKVTNLVNGKTVQCTVTNRGPYSPGRIIDLSDEGFAQIAPLSQGLAEVRVEW